MEKAVQEIDANQTVIEVAVWSRPQPSFPAVKPALNNRGIMAN